MGRPTLPIKSPKRLVNPRRRSVGRTGSASSATALAARGSAAGASGAAGVAANIRVAVRVRPENSREQAGAFRNVINVVDEKMLIFDPKEDEEVFYFQGKKQGRRDLNKKENKDQKFAFDSVYTAGSTNMEIFEGTTKDLVDVTFNGYNCSVFAYGATGAGKTFTMLGAKDCPGITFLTMKQIYEKIETVKDKSCEIGISYLEVYNETVIDLLSPGAQLNIRENGPTTTIPGLSIHKPTGPDHILSLLSFGNGNRTQHATDANKESSRSHAVLQVFIRQKDKAAGLSTEVKVAKMSLIDLAGSEKGGVTGNKGARFREGSNINKSLLALGNCINALADGSKYIPYRNSKLTRLLKDSIGGNCRTVMIANVSPSSETFEDTFNTLKYADRAKKIKINLKKNVLNVDFHIAQYAKIVEDLRGEITLLKERIQELENENQTLKTRDGVEGGLRRGSDNQDMEVDSTNTEVAVGSAANTAQSSEDTNNVDNNSVRLEALQQTLNRYIERQKDFDIMQESLAVFEKKHVEQTQQIELLEATNRSNQIVGSFDQSKISLDIARYQARIKELEEKANVQIEGDGGEKEDKLETLVELHRGLVSKVVNEQSTLVNLKLRIHFKKQIHERNEKITIGQTISDKSTMKTAKAVESLEKKVQRKELRKKSLLEEILKSRQDIDQFIANNPSHLCSKNAMLEVQLMESKAESRHLSSMISTMGSKIETQDTDLNATLKVLRKNHVCLRGHELASNADQKDFEELRDQLLENRLKWSENLNEYSDKDSEILAIHIYNEAAKLDLPTLNSEDSRPKSVEQKVLFEETIIGNETSIFNNDTIDIDNDGTFVEKIVDENQFTLPPTPIFIKSEGESLFASVLPPTPNLRTKLDDEMLPTTPKIFGFLQNSSFELLPPTPQLHSAPTPIIRKESDKSFLVATPTPPLLQTLLKKSAYDPEDDSAGLSTPKRAAEEPFTGSASKRAKLDVPAEIETAAAWAAHRETVTIPPTPKAVEDSVSNLNETFETVPDSPTGAEVIAPTNLNETVTLVTKLDKQCELNSPVMKTAPRNLNSTFAVDEEPMDVDSTNTKNIPPLMSSLSVSDMSIIHPPVKPQTAAITSSHSPIKAGMGVPSPTNTTVMKRSPIPSPLRQSTLLDIKPPARKPSPTSIPRRSPRNDGLMAPPVKSVGMPSVRKGRPTPSKSSTTPQPVRKTVAKRSLTHSVSTSVLPRPGQPTQPVSFRSTLARINPETDQDQPAYMAGTNSSKIRHGGTLERKKNLGFGGSIVNLAKENPGQEVGKTKGLAATVTNKLGTGLGKLRKSVSTNVLKTTNKN